MHGTSVVGIGKVRDPRSRPEQRQVLFDLLDQLVRRSPLTCPPGGTIFIKPNICLVKGPETGATVDPYLVGCLADWLNLHLHPGRIIIGEADATMLNVDIAFRALGWEEMVTAHPNATLLNISKDTRVETRLNGRYFETIALSAAYAGADLLISFAKLKTHTMTGITGNLKNLYGANPEKFKAQYHPHLDEVICDLCQARMPDIAIVDGIIAMEGDGPISGAPRPAGLLVVGNDAVSTDHACARIMGFRPRSIRHLSMAAARDLGRTRYDLFGIPLESVRSRFQRVSLGRRIITGVYHHGFTRLFSFFHGVRRAITRISPP
jgi:uncharacterized protein (DUF362 family)